MERENKTLLYFLSAILMAITLYSCGFPTDTGGDQSRPPQTKILKVLVQPDTVAPSDTAAFTCVITDSMDSRFTFYWFIGFGKVEGAKLIGIGNVEYTSESSWSIKWIAPDKSDTYYFLVSVDNGSSDSVSVDKNFSITVK